MELRCGAKRKSSHMGVSLLKTMLAILGPKTLGKRNMSYLLLVGVEWHLAYV